MNNPIIFEVEFEIAPIRHAYVTCPECGRKYCAQEITENRLHSAIDLQYAKFQCPICGCSFSGHDRDWTFSKIREVEVREVPYPECAKGALEKKEVWE